MSLILERPARLVRYYDMRQNWIIPAGFLALTVALLVGIGLGRWTAPQSASAHHIASIPPVAAGSASTPSAAPTPLAPAISPETRKITATDFEVIRVIDGDTFKVHYDGDVTSVRMLDINAPERGDPRAKAATDELRRLIDGQTVQLDFAAARRRDNFGRLLCRVVINGIDVGQHLLDTNLVSIYQPGPRRTNAAP